MGVKKQNYRIITLSENGYSSEQQKTIFQFFNEIGIIQQLSVTVFNQVMPDGLHISHFIAINHLIRSGDGRTPLQMANALQVTKATMTHTISVLKKRAFIEVHPNQTDGRSKLIYLTTAGRQFRKKAILSLEPLLAFIGGNCDVSELAEALPMLEKLRILMDENRTIMNTD
jgi:DNA-binding MarR family transcriptional regulator